MEKAVVMATASAAVDAAVATVSAAVDAAGSANGYGTAETHASSAESEGDRQGEQEGEHLMRSESLSSCWMRRRSSPPIGRDAGASSLRWSQRENLLLPPDTTLEAPTPEPSTLESPTPEALTLEPPHAGRDADGGGECRGSSLIMAKRPSLEFKKGFFGQEEILRIFGKASVF